MMKITLDAGHGGSDPGACGQSGLYEKDITLKITKIVGEILAGQNINVHYTRDTDVFVDLSPRASSANNACSNLFVSIHVNSASNASAKGIETFSFGTGGEGEKLAKKVQNRLISAVKATDRGTKTANFAVLRLTNMPAILTEVGFISNAEEENKLKDEKYLDTLAEAIAQGVFDYLGMEVNVVVETKEQAVQILVEKGVINSPDYWLTACEVVNYLDRLLINMARKLV